MKYEQNVINKNKNIISREILPVEKTKSCPIVTGD